MQDIWQINKLSRRDLTLELLPGIGGRLWDVVYKDRPLLFKNNELFGCVPDIAALTDLPSKSPQFGFPLWGGEKTWIAPDTSWIGGAPFPVLDSGSYEVVSNDTDHLMMRSAVCPLSQLQIEREIRTDTDSSWSIHHRIVNRGQDSRYTGIWSVLMLDRPARIGLISENPKVTPVFGNANGHINCQRKSVICDCQSKAEFKIGTDNPTGKVFLHLGDQSSTVWVMCSTAPPSNSDDFAHSHHFEIFNSGDYPYCEAEWHAPARHLDPGESVSFIQKFTVWSCDQPPAPLNISAPEQELMKCMS